MRDQEYYLDSLIRCYDEGVSPGGYISYNCMWELAKHSSDEVRIWLARALVNYEDAGVAVPLLCHLSRDPDPLVRVEAVDSMSCFPCRCSFDALCDAFCDEEDLVRAYAALGVADVGNVVSPVDASELLAQYARTEKSKRVLVDIYVGMYLLGKTEALNNVFELFDVPDYHVKCAVLNSLEEIVDENSLSIIRRFMQSIDKTILDKAVVDSILRVEARINNP